ncbi:hypothetical protein LSH36_964g00012 [Paralvinella palmiformis]|uniref:Integral membrane protein 2 n=1 Tax=Paralvinella palmiformis TaxID=53620 RepID=A0AAD9IYE5_9ANNE|nr:hypothetical protein LSH36_964g00012 [Paralvinella palmiformis]
MTIYAPYSAEKKEDTEYLRPEVVTETLPPPKKKDEASIAVVALTPTRRHGNIASICVLLAALVVFAVGILGGIYLYNRLAHRRYEGWCGVSYYEHQMEGYIPGDALGYHGEQQYYSMHGEFEEHIEIDKEEGKFEKIEVPEFADCKQATILHDFDKNGYYLPDTEIVREKYRVITPQIENLSPFGYYIWKECRWFDTFRMVREGEPVALSRRKKRNTQFSCGDLAHTRYSLGDAGTAYLRNIEITSCI